MGKVREYPGDGFAITFDAKRCIHAEECVHGLPGVFDPQRRPWIDASKADLGEIGKVVARCPTGALALRGGPAEPVPETNTANLSVNGPIYLHGDIELTLPDGELARGTRVALCRCGQSGNKPFCDNAHLESRFVDAGTLQPVGGDRGEKGPLAVRAVPKGPLLVQGPLSLQSADGEASIHTTKTALCRCGASKEKPFCDGSHMAIGFEAE